MSICSNGRTQGNVSAVVPPREHARIEKARQKGRCASEAMTAR